jgi:glycosyltransferase involved in cell wall biosynthesis
MPDQAVLAADTLGSGATSLPAPTGRVSVLISTYNRAVLLEESLASVLDQTVAPFQVIVIDDGSTDDTAKRVARFGSQVEYMFKDNAGKSSALNAALPRVTGDYVWVFDDDDVALPTSIETRLSALQANPDAGVVFSRHRWGASGPDGRIEVHEEIAWPAVGESNLLLTLMRGCFTTLQGALARTESYRAVGLFREELLRSQDYDMLIRLARRCGVVLLDQPTFIFRRHGDQRGPATLRHAVDEREKLWARYDGTLGRALRREAELGEFLTPPVRAVLTSAQSREAILNRMSVMASKGLASELIDDAAEFAEQVRAAHSEITAAEQAVAKSSLQHRYFLFNVMPEHAAFLQRARVLGRTPQGRTLLRAFARGLLGLARWDGVSWQERLQTLRLAVQLGWIGLRPREAR